MTTGAIVARFQVPYLHTGHIHLLNEVWSRSDKLLIILGSKTTPDERNILPFEVRIEMIRDSYPFAHFEQIKDHREDDHWTEHLDQILYMYPNTTLYGSRDCFIKHYKGKFPFIEIPEVRGFSGTTVRSEMKVVNNAYYRMGLINGFNLK